MTVSDRRPGTHSAQPSLQVLRRLTALKTGPDPERACQEAARILAGEAAGFRFALVFILDCEPARLAAAAGAGRHRARLADPAAWPLLEAAQTAAPVRVESPAGPALVVPISSPSPVRTVPGCLVLGLATGALDPAVLAFAQVAAAQVGAAIAGSAAYVDALTRAEESERLQAQMARMVELEKLKSEFLRLASHELRGPLAVVRGYLDMVNGGTFGPVPRPIDSVLPIVTGKVDEMNRLVEQMLETARLEENRVLLSATEFDLRQVTRECANALLPLAAGTHTFRFQLAAEPVPVLADRTRIAGIVTNVIDNAIKYSPDGGEIAITCVADAERGSAVVTVEDHGIGIDGPDLPRLFTRFGRIVNEDNSHIPGTGLGLYLAREIARMHSGDIAISSRRNEGTRIVVSLPLSAPRRAPEKAAEFLATDS